MCSRTSQSEEEQKEARETKTLLGLGATADWLQGRRKKKNTQNFGCLRAMTACILHRDDTVEDGWWSWWRGVPFLPLKTHVVSQTVGLIGYGQSGELPQSQLALHGLIWAHDEGLPRSGRERQRLNWDGRRIDRSIERDTEKF